MVMMRIAVLLTAISTAIASCPTTLDLSVEIDDGTMLYYAIVPPYLCGRLEVEHEDGEGWIGLGFSGSTKMDDGWAIVGIPAEATVLKYDLFHDVATAMDTTKQTLTGTSITSSGDGLVVMEFVTLMEEDGEVPILVGENPVLFSYGGAEFGMHTHDAHPTITLEGSNIAVVADDVENETLAPTYASSFATTPVPSPVDASTEDVSVDAPTENAKNDATPAEVPVDTPAENPPPAEKSDGTVTCSLSIKISFSMILFVVALFS
jgi:hypothetical protein